MALPRGLTRDFDYLETLKALLRAYLVDGYPSAQKMAAAMDISVRTMARRLSAQGLSYRAVVDEVRFESAKQLLLVKDLRISEVARAVGFDDPSHFSRLFRRIGGLSPRQYRRGDLGLSRAFLPLREAMPSRAARRSRSQLGGGCRDR